MKIQNLIFSLILIIGVLSCTTDPKPTEPQKASLYGKWELKEAFTNNKPTQRLDGAFLQFKEDETLTTNILGSENTIPFELNKSIILQKTAPEVTYDIEKLEANELVVVMTLSSKKFKLKLSKSE